MPRTFPQQPTRISSGTTATGAIAPETTYRKFGEQPAKIKNK